MIPESVAADNAGMAGRFWRKLTLVSSRKASQDGQDVGSGQLSPGGSSRGSINRHHSRFRTRPLRSSIRRNSSLLSLDPETIPASTAAHFSINELSARLKREKNVTISAVKMPTSYRPANCWIILAVHSNDLNPVGRKESPNGVMPPPAAADHHHLDTISESQMTADSTEDLHMDSEIEDEPRESSAELKLDPARLAGKDDKAERF